LAGTVTDANSLQILENAKLTLFDKNFKIIKEIYSDALGNYSFDVECGKKYYVRTEKIEYETKEQHVFIQQASGKTDLPVALSKKLQEVSARGGDISKAFSIKEILFDLDKSNIRTDAAIDIEKIIDVMKQYPSMVVNIHSHTDSRASRKYNEALSDRRAKVTLDYMVLQGIDRKRLSSKGFGESQLTNKC
jgi:outer membrane protein OmpA-like peptidoglycan-associated protein